MKAGLQLSDKSYYKTLVENDVIGFLWPLFERHGYSLEIKTARFMPKCLRRSTLPGFMLCQRIKRMGIHLTVIAGIKSCLTLLVPGY